jgi:photosystem I P700 chlorophyll a apoprotein A2
MLEASYRFTTTGLLSALGNIHGIKNNQASEGTLISQIFQAHLAQISIIGTWVSGNMFHVAWQSNYSYWCTNPSRTIAIAHNIWDPNYGLYSSDVYSVGYTDVSAIMGTSGINQWLYSVGVRNEEDIYMMSIGVELISLMILMVGIVQKRMYRALQERGDMHIEIAYTSPGYRLNYHTGILLGLSSLLWSGHLVHVSIPASRGSKFEYNMDGIKSGNWMKYALNQDGQTHIHGSKVNSGTSLLSFIGTLKESSSSLTLTDIAHHHLALGVLLVWAAHIYRSIQMSVGHRIRDLSASTAIGVEVNKRSLDLELSISLVAAAQGSAFFAQHVYSIPAYVYLTTDYITITALYVHHIWISAFCMIGALTHGGIYLIKHFTQGTVYSISNKQPT